MKDYEKFDRYHKVQMEGKFNMITESVQAAAAAGLTLEDYRDVQKNYSTYKIASEVQHTIEEALQDAPF